MRSPPSLLGLSAFLALPSLISAVTFDCSHLRIDHQSFDLSELAGPRSVHLIEDTPPSISNTTFTIDICNPLQRTKGVPKADECPGGTRVCGIEYDYNYADNSQSIKRVIPIAGSYETSHGRPLEPQLTRLKGSASHSDAEREGLRVELNGGRYPFDSGKQQKAIIEFVCDAERTGLEGTEEDSRKKIDDEEEKRGLQRRADDKEETGHDKGGSLNGKNQTVESSLQFVSYKDEGEGSNEIGVLRLNWRTQHACEGETEHEPAKKSKNGGMGGFAWFIIVFFLVIASYLIFGSWLNYNRYGARGWDLLPHGDTIRDLPYAIKEWGSSCIGALKGRGARGGYSAV